MNFDWLEYLNFAKNCCDLNSGVIDEAACRASISRAYYAAFCLSRNYLRDHGDYVLQHAYIGDPIGISMLNGSVHNYVIEKFTDDSKPEKANIGLTLKNLKFRRAYADYKDHQVNDLGKKVLESLEYAQSIIDELEKL
jgi:hypothetical protein